MTERILILDFGSQYTQLIARRVRENGVYCEILPCTADDAAIRAFAPSAVILSGGPASTTEAAAPLAPEAVFDQGVPILGICYGEQTICAQLGGKVEVGQHREFGRAFLDVTGRCALFEGVFEPGAREQVWMSHGDRIVELPPGFRVVATSDGSPFAAIADDERRIYGVQFHPEVVHTPRGQALLRNFSHRVAGCRGEWSMAAFREGAIARIRQQVGRARVICGLSGGVDSAVTALLLHEAIGEQLVCVFVDTGLLRAGEPEQIVELFRGHFNIPLISVDAEALFLERLAGVSDPEQKRKAIGRTFIEVFEDQARSLGEVDFLAQGTLYPDVIESVSFQGPSVTIKSHHNVGGLPERMQLGLVEPLRELFKDEVRAARPRARSAGGVRAAAIRSPAPGSRSGSSARSPEERLDVLRQADVIFLEEIRIAGLYDAIWQAFAVLLPVRTVGVMGDARTYENVCALRAVTSLDGMTADFFHFDMEFLGRVANRIVNEVRGINRVVYDVTSKPPGTIEWE